MRTQLKNRMFLTMFRGVELKCFFYKQIPPAVKWSRTLEIRNHIYNLWDEVEECALHPEFLGGCYCPVPVGGHNDGQSSSFCIAVIRQLGEKMMKELICHWREFVRWRYFTDGPISCAATGVEVTTAELIIEHQCYDQNAVAEFIATFDCE
jgi:hypothetical protein